jgi:hypothetical protein
VLSVEVRAAMLVTQHREHRGHSASSPHTSCVVSQLLVVHILIYLSNCFVFDLSTSPLAVIMHRCNLLLVVLLVLSVLSLSHAYAPPASIPSFPLYNAAVPGLTTPAIGVGFGGSDTRTGTRTAFTAYSAEHSS